MTAFGQNIIPTIYEDNTFRTFSKAGMLSHLVRALVTVGMEPLTGLWPFDPIAEPEFPLQQGQVYPFAFDYPDDGGVLTFNVNGTLYRPCLLVVVGHGNEDLTTNPGRMEKTLLVENAIRFDGPPVLDNIYTMSRTRGQSGLIGLGTPTTAYDTVYPDQSGQQITKEDWLPYQGSVAGNQSTLAVGHWFVYLGPAGLFVYVGGGSGRVAFGDQIAMGCIFGGARIPGRAKPVLEDSNLARINPAIPMYLRETNTAGTAGSNFWHVGGSNPLFDQTFRPKIHRMQADLKFTEEIVNSWLFNLENVEYPIFPLYQPDTRPSPREISTGGGGHILAYAVHVPDGLETDATDKYGPIIPSLHASEVRPLYEDVFTGLGFRFCDISAPLGLHTDPNTLLDWFLVPTYNSGQTIGLLHENGTTVDTLATVTLTASGSDFYNMTTSGWSSVFPTPVTILETGTSTAVWSDDPGFDRQIFVVPDQISTQTYQVQWNIDLDTGDPGDTLYQVSFAAFNRDDPQTGSNPSEGFNPLLFQYNFNGVWITVLTIECAGTNPAFVNSEGELSYTPQSYAAFVAKDTSLGTPRLTVRWNVQGDTQRGANGEVTTITVNKFRYL
jgi:hypothetical protein